MKKYSAWDDPLRWPESRLHTAGQDNLATQVNITVFTVWLEQRQVKLTLTICRIPMHIPIHVTIWITKQITFNLARRRKCPSFSMLSRRSSRVLLPSPPLKFCSPQLFSFLMNDNVFDQYVCKKLVVCIVPCGRPRGYFQPPQWMLSRSLRFKVQPVHAGNLSQRNI